LKDTFQTIVQEAEGLFKEKGSKFLAFTYPVETEIEVKEKIDQLKKQYYDARHHCYAYVLGNEGEQYRANDDGEPNHSAGDPILGQIRSKELTNVLVVVVRYFGGTKLGVPGLINAYKVAAADALDKCEIVEKLIVKKMKLHFGYPELNNVMRIIKEFDLDIVDQKLELDCEMVISVRLKLVETVIDRITQLLHVEIKE
jgi:uncharacterized YigZ family protein